MAVISAADKGLAVERNGISLTCCVVAEGGEPGALAASAAVRPGLAGGPEPAGIVMLGQAAQPQAANKAAEHEHAARAASGQQEPECQPHSGGAEPGAAIHSAPPVRACAAKVTATATPKNVPVAARESGEPMEQPARPCPLVQPPAQRVPYPSARPATVTSGSRTATGKLWDRTG